MIQRRKLIGCPVRLGLLACGLGIGIAAAQETGSAVAPPSARPQAPAAAKREEKRKITIHAVRLRGNRSITAATLLPVVLPWLNREVTLSDLEDMTAAVTAHYRKLGYLVAQARLPAQKVESATIELDIVEGTYSDIVIRTNKSRVDSAQILRMFMANACGSDTGCQGVTPILRADVERAGILVSELPGANTSLELQVGQAPGTTSIAIDVDAAPTLSGNLGVDNDGSAYTGRNRVSAALSAASLFGVGDLTTLNGTYSGRGLTSVAADFSLPVGASGLRAGLTLSHLEYVLGGSFASLGATGTADAIGAYASYPLRRSLRESVDLRADMIAKRIGNAISAADTHSRETALESIVSLSGSAAHDLFHAGVTQGRLALTAGRLMIEDATTQAADAATAQTVGGFGKFNYQLRHEETAGPGRSIYVSLSGQRALANLDPSEKFQMGGPGAMRAYPVGEAPADSATVLSIEGRFSLPAALIPGKQLTIAPFFDRGWARLSQYPWNGYTGPAHAVFTSTGAYISLLSPNQYSLRATWALRVGDAATANNDARSQFWLEAGLAF